MTGPDLRLTPPPSKPRTMPDPAPRQMVGSHGQPLLEDGTVDVRELCRRLDAYWNRGAGEIR